MMKISALAALACIVFSTNVQAVPLKRATIDDTTVLNFALTLEHIENAFYTQALAQFDDAAFVAAGFHPWVRGRFVQIAEHEKTHVDTLTAALGSAATKACNYSFPYTDPVSFAKLSGVFEGVGTSAYTGAAQLLSSKEHLTTSASILATEGRQAAWVTAAVLSGSPWGGAFEVPLTLNEAFTLAAPFIKSCPSTNPVLPVKAFPALTIASPKPGATVKPVFNASSTAAKTPLYLGILTGIKTTFVEIKNGEARIPSDVFGVTYVVVSKNSTVANDDTVVAGPALVDFGENSAGKATT